MSGSATPAAGELAPALRARGRRLAITSHLAGMTHRLVYTDQLPTLALVALGASDSIVGLQRALEPVGQLLQLPTLRAVGRFRKRSILVVGQIISVIGGAPLIAFGFLASGAPPWPLAITLASLVVAAAGIVITDTVWFPLLRGYVEPERTGHFFGLLRSTWHLILIVYFLAAQRWIAAHPGAFGPLFAVATACGVLRVALVALFPEAPAEMGDRIRVREVLVLLRHDAALRRYLAGVGLCGGARSAVVPFVIVVMRRVLGLSEGDVLLTTLAYFAGGVVSLYLWGRAVDRFGPAPVFRGTAIGIAALYTGLLWVDQTSASVGLMVGFFFALNVLAGGFGVADTHVLFGLAPVHAPTRLLVAADVTSSLLYGIAPFAAGFALDAAFAVGVAPLSAYRTLFVLAALASLLSLVPLRGFRK
jgi:hypothetical protein